MRDDSIENLNATEPCVPWDVDYVTGAQGSVDSIVADCAVRNEGNNCAIRACIIEGWFVMNIFQEFFTGPPLDTTLSHDEGGFIPREQCTMQNHAGIPSEKSCCGTYPFRHP